jgi:uncharacterized membrane protein YqjE
MLTTVRRIIGALGLAILAGYTVHWVDWHPKEWSTMFQFQVNWNNLGLAVLTILAAVAVVWGFVSDSRKSTLAGYAGLTYFLLVGIKITGGFMDAGLGFGAIATAFGLLLLAVMLFLMAIWPSGHSSAARTTPTRLAKFGKWLRGKWRGVRAWFARKRASRRTPVAAPAPDPSLHATVFGPAPSSRPTRTASVRPATSPVVDHTHPAASASGTSTP